MTDCILTVIIFLRINDKFVNSPIRNHYVNQFREQNIEAKVSWLFYCLHLVSFDTLKKLTCKNTMLATIHIFTVNSIPSLLWTSHDICKTVSPWNSGIEHCISMDELTSMQYTVTPEDISFFASLTISSVAS